MDGITHAHLIRQGIDAQNASRVMSLLARSPLSAVKIELRDSRGMRFVKKYDRAESISYLKSKVHLEYLADLLDKL